MTIEAPVNRPSTRQEWLDTAVAFQEASVPYNRRTAYQTEQRRQTQIAAAEARARQQPVVTPQQPTT